jgi:sulfonate transport system permease protein
MTTMSELAVVGTDTGPATPARPKPPGSPRRLWAIIGGAVIPLAVLGLWSALSLSGAIPSYKLPSPLDVLNAGIELAQSGKYGSYIAISMQRVFLGFAIGSLVGLVLGAVVGLSKLGSILLSPTIGGIRAVPSLAWVPLLILYMGILEDSKVTLIAIGALFPVYTTVATALRHVDPQLVELGRAFGRGGVSLLTTVQLPAVVPSVVAGLRLALAQSWLFLVAAELIASSMGIGYLLVESQNNGRLDRIFLAIVTLAVLGKATDGLIGLLERFLLKRWG